LNKVLVDTGPLVAILLRADEHHEVCVQTLHRLPTPLYTCWPVLTEAVWLLRFDPAAACRLLRSVEGGLLRLFELVDSEAGKIAGLLEKYGKIRPQLADATLVHLACRERVDTIFTLDRRDFSIYRTFGNRSFRILPD